MTGLLGSIATAGVVNVTQEDKCIARLQFSGDSLLVIGPAISIPQVRARNCNSGTILLGGFSQRRNTTDHARHLVVGRVVVTFENDQ